MAEIVMTIDQLAGRLEVFASKVPRAAYSALQLGLADALRDVVLNRLSGQYLRVRTGTLRKSVVTSTQIGTDRITGAIGSGLGYARVHELGFEGAVNVRSHARRLRLHTASGRVRSERVRLNDALRGRRTGTTVRAHSRYMRVRARHFFRDTIRQLAGASAFSTGPTLGEYLTRAFEILARTGQAPSPGEIASGVWK